MSEYAVDTQALVRFMEGKRVYPAAIQGILEAADRGEPAMHVGAHKSAEREGQRDEHRQRRQA